MLLAGVALLSHADADEGAARAWYERCRAVVESIEPQAELERTAYLEDLSQCAAEGKMTAEDAHSAAQRLEGFLSAVRQEELSGRPQAPGHRKDGKSEIEMLLLPETTGLFNHPAGLRFQRQLRALDVVQKEAIPALQAAACDYAVEVWLAAKKPSDLEPALRALTVAKATISGVEWWIASGSRAGASFAPGTSGVGVARTTLNTRYHC